MVRPTLPSLVEYLIVAYFMPSLLNLVILDPTILNLIIPEYIKMALPLESTLLDYIQFITALVVVVVSLILGYKIYKKNPDYWLNKVFTAFYVGIGLAAISFNLGLFINPIGLIIGEQFMLAFIMISLGLLLIVAIGLNYGEVQILNPKAIIPIILFVALPLTVLWLPGSVKIQDVAPPDIVFSDFLTVTLLITLMVGLIVISYFLIKVYRVSEGIVKKRIFLFLIGILFTLLLGGVSTSLASILTLHIFDLLSPLIILIGISIVYYGFHISE